MIRLVPGQIVNIGTLTHDGRPVVEGRARLYRFTRKLAPGFEEWHVRFLTEPENLYLRCVAVQA